VDFGHIVFNATLARDFNCTSGGPLDICTICEVLGCEWDIPGGPGWVEQEPTFTAVTFEIGNQKSVFVSMPGEALTELGTNVRTTMTQLGFNITLLFGYTNNYMMYFCPPDEYVLGGYECVLTLWGINTATMIYDGSVNAVKAAMMT